MVNEAVRKAHQLTPDQFVLSGGFDGTLPPEVLEKVRSELVPDAASISASLLKINVYSSHSQRGLLLKATRALSPARSGK